MSKGILHLILVLTVVTASQASTSSILTSLLRVQTFAYANNPCADIRNGQFVCLDCSTLAVCVQEGGNWMTVQVAPCPTAYSMYCNEDSKSCVLQKECLLPPKGVRFECQNPGKYPDPYNCKVYHECSNLNKDTRIMCPSGTFYSTATQNCQQSTTDADVCGKAEYRCDYPGMMGSWPSDNNIYYICNVKRIDGEVIYYPLMYRCPTGEVFDGKKCVSTTNANGNNGNNNNGNPSGASCKEKDFTAHPSNCRAYYHCENGKDVLYQCPQNTYYNAKKAACESGKC